MLEGGGGGGATGLLNKGGGSNRLPGLVTKQQAVEFPQVLTSRPCNNAQIWHDYDVVVYFVNSYYQHMHAVRCPTQVLASIYNYMD